MNTTIKNILLTFTLRSFTVSSEAFSGGWSVVGLILMTTLITNSMEIVPLKTFEKNIRNYNLTDKNIELPVLPQEEPIQAKAYINTKHKIFYGAEVNHKELKVMGIPPYLNDPLIILNITDVNNKKLVITNHENKQTTLDLFFLPVAYLHNKKTNDIIELKLYNHPIQIKCVKDPEKTTEIFSDFDDEFDTLKQLFKFNPRFTVIFPVTINNKILFPFWDMHKPLIENQIMENKTYSSLGKFNNNNGYFFSTEKYHKHGKNGYKFNQIATNILKHKQGDNPYTFNGNQNIFSLLKDRQTNGSFVNKRNIR